MENLTAQIASVRRFNRAYTRRLGLLDKGLLKSPFSLVEARVIYELAQRDGMTATEIATTLGLDPGYLSRIIANLARRRVIAKSASAEDRRATILSLSKAGRTAFAELDRRSREEIGRMFEPLSEAKRRELVSSMATIERLLDGKVSEIAIRTHAPGDLGWIVEAHGRLYAREYGFDGTFEALVAEIAAKFLREYDPSRERCWIAEMDGKRAGSVMLVKHADGVAKLRLLLVEPEARGLSIGRRLIEECICFAKAAGYREITLWTNSILHDARRLYERFGFVLASETPHRSFGRDLVGQDWSLRLASP